MIDDAQGMRPMRLMQVIADGRPGGGTSHVLQLLEWLRPSCELALVTEPGSYLGDAARRMGVLVREVDFFNSSRAFAALGSLRRASLEFEPQVLHVHGSRAAAFAALAGRSVPSVYTVHGIHYLQRSWLVRRFRFSLEKRVMVAFDCIVFVSHHDCAIASAAGLLGGAKAWHVIHNGIRLRQPAAYPTEPNAGIGFVGRLEYQKDPLLFLAVVERLREYPALVIGGGRLLERVRREIQARALSQVRLLGEKSHGEVLAILPRLSVLVLTSRWEGLPLTVLEAMWAGVPVVAIKAGSMDEVIDDGVSGVLVDSRDPQTIADAVRRVLLDPALRDRIITNARERVRAYFSEERMLGELGRVYDSLLTTARHNPTL